MQLFKLLPLVALVPLAAAQQSVDVRAVFTLLGPGKDVEITTSECVKFENTKAKYDNAFIGDYVCELFAAPDCKDSVVRFKKGYFNIIDTKFKSVRCLPE